MALRSSELMIGDWVYDTILCGNTKVIEITSNKIKGDIHEQSYPDSGFNPIPLTGEILEKNGFTHSFGDSDFYDYEKWEKKVDDKTIRVIKDHDGWVCRIDDIKLTRSMGIAPSVHTMQHIIRIGGIEKEIEL